MTRPSPLHLHSRSAAVCCGQENTTVTETFPLAGYAQAPVVVAFEPVNRGRRSGCCGYTDTVQVFVCRHPEQYRTTSSSETLLDL